MSQPSEDAEIYHGYSVDGEDQPQSTGDSSGDDRGMPEPLDEGISPPERWSIAEKYGNTDWEAAHSESLDARLAQEEPDVSTEPIAEDVGGEVGRARAGRLVDGDSGNRTDTDSELYASDVGIDGAGASAEEAAVHVIPDVEDLLSNSSD